MPFGVFGCSALPERLLHGGCPPSPPQEDLTGSFGQSTTVSRNPPEGSAGMGDPEAPHHYLWAARDREGSFWEASAWDGPARVSGHRPPLSHTEGALLGAMLGTWGLRALPRPSPSPARQRPPAASGAAVTPSAALGPQTTPHRPWRFPALLCSSASVSLPISGDGVPTP